MNQSDIDFYDKFTVERMVGYRLKPNQRLAAAKEFVLTYVRSDSVVADLGCGIGIVTEAVAQSASNGSVAGFDYSKNNIEYARRTVDLPNVKFVVSSVTTQGDDIGAALPSAPNVVIMTDVIEHIPEDARENLFRDVHEMSDDEAVFLLTYPSADYQRHLWINDPEELQPIDSIIEPYDLIGEAHSAGWRLESFRLVDVWLKGQYVHVAFRKGADRESLSPVAGNKFANLTRKFWDTLNAPKRKKRYVTDAFENWPEDQNAKE